jgi:glycosyltransferase 2 family protein
MINRRWRSWLQVAQIIITLGLIAILLRSVDWAALLPLLDKARWELVLLSIAVTLTIHLINVVRWRYLLQSRAIGYRRLLMCYGAGLFSNNFLPTGIGGDGVRAALLRRDLPLSRAIFSVGLDRIISLLALSALLVPGLWFGLPPGLQLQGWRAIVAPGEWSVALVATLLIVIAGGGAALIAWRQIPKLRRPVDHMLARLSGYIEELRQTSSQWYRLLLGGYMLSIISHVFLIAVHWMLFQALLLDVSPGAAIWLVLLAAVSSLLPITVNGLGLQESIYVVVLGHYGASAPAALGVGLLIRMLMLFCSLLGGMLVLGWQVQRPGSISNVEIPM